MANINNNISLTTSSTNSLVYSSGSSISSGSWNISLSEDLSDFFELVLAALGHDITYENSPK